MTTKIDLIATEMEMNKNRDKMLNNKKKRNKLYVLCLTFSQNPSMIPSLE